MRANRASDEVSETPTFSSPISGRNSPDCRVVNATRVPIVMPPEVAGRPAER